jgi:MFS family permease
VYVFNALTFLWSAAFIVRLQSPGSEAPKEKPAEEREPFLRHASAGFRAILGDRNLRLIIGVFCAQTVVAGALVVIVVTLALDQLHIRQSGVGYLDAVLGVGGLVGGFVALVLAQRGRLALDFGAGVLLWSTPLLAVAAWPTVGVAAAAMALIGVGNSLVDVNAYTILQRAVPDDVMGRVFGAMGSAIIGAMALGSLLMPILIRTIGLRAGLVALGGTVVVIVLIALAGLRRIDMTVLAPVGLGLLRRVSILAPLPEPIIERLARALDPVGASAGNVVISKNGRFVARLGPADYFGEIALLQAVPRTATVTAETDVRLYALNREVFIPAVTGHHDVEELAETSMTTRLAML